MDHNARPLRPANAAPDAASRDAAAAEHLPGFVSRVSAADRLRAVRLAGALYGLLFALGFSAAFWGYNSWRLAEASAARPWDELSLGLALALPLGLLAGLVAIWTDRALVRGAIWLAAGLAMIWLAGHIQYEGLSWLLDARDRYPTGRLMYPFTGAAAEATGLTMFFGTGLALAAGLLEAGAAEHAWLNAWRERYLGPSSLASLALRALPFALAAGLLSDVLIHVPLRSEVLDTARAIGLARDPAVRLRDEGLSFLERYRERLRTPYRIYRVTNASETVSSTALDVRFADGFLMRCEYANQVIVHCTALDSDLAVWARDLATLGHLTCAGCQVRVEPEVRRWLHGTRSAHGPLQTVSFDAHQGGWLYMRLRFAGGAVVDCRFRGSRPIVVDLCIDAP
jgi:hypothetical protein